MTYYNTKKLAKIEAIRHNVRGYEFHSTDLLPIFFLLQKMPILALDEGFFRTKVNIYVTATTAGYHIITKKNTLIY